MLALARKSYIPHINIYSLSSIRWYTPQCYLNDFTLILLPRPLLLQLLWFLTVRPFTAEVFKTREVWRSFFRGRVQHYWISKNDSSYWIFWYVRIPSDFENNPFWFWEHYCFLRINKFLMSCRYSGRDFSSRAEGILLSSFVRHNGYF